MRRQSIIQLSLTWFTAILFLISGTTLSAAIFFSSTPAQAATVALPMETGTTTCPGNLISNPSFESDRSGYSPAGWSGSGKVGAEYPGFNTPAGTKFAYVTGNKWMWVSVTPIVGKSYVATFYSGSHNPNPTQQVRLTVYDATSTPLAQSIHTIVADMEDLGTFGGPYTLSIGPVPNGATEIRFEVTDGGNDYAKIDGVCMSETTTAPTATPTNTQTAPTATATKTPVPPTATPTKTVAPPTATPTKTSVPPTATPTNTPVSVSCPANLISNPGFENDTVKTHPIGWSGSGWVINEYTGFNTQDGVKFAYVTGNQWMWYTVPSTVGKSYEATFYSGSHNPNPTQQVRLTFYDASLNVLAQVTHTIVADMEVLGQFGGPYTLKLGPAPAGTNELRFEVTDGGNDFAKIDGVCLREAGSPTATPTNTPVPPTATPTNTKVPPTATPTNTPVPPTATPTNTPVPPTATPTNTKVPPTATPTNTPVPPTATPTNTSVPPTATPTNTKVPPTATPTATPTNTTVPPTATPTNTPKLGSLGNQVWYDVNHSADQGSNPTYVSGVRVDLLQGCASGIVLGTQFTDSNGYYTFFSLPAGQYRVLFSNLPVGYEFTRKDQGLSDITDSDANANGFTDCITLAAGEDNPTVDAGIVKIEPTATPTNTPVPPTATPTNTKVPPTATPTHTPVPPTATPTNTPVPPTATPINTPVALASLGNYVWLDENKNGSQDSTEKGVRGITVELLNSQGTVLVTTTTDADGLYLFANLTPGEYKVHFVHPTKYLPTKANQGSDDELDSDANTSTFQTELTQLVAGENDLSWDYGIFLSEVESPDAQAALGDYVWEDADRNGVQTAGEKPLANVTVLLYNGQGQVISTTVTDNTGHYWFYHLNPGSYVVEFVPPNGYQLTENNIGDDALDSDIAADTHRTPLVTLAAGQINPTLDAGFYPVPTSDENSPEVPLSHIFLPLMTR
ncbi:MAG: SdrD B-like domain-containing protein [Caldilineaceae bacterium]